LSFSDFDGVLHSFTDRHVQPYRDLRRLEAVLREYPAVSAAQREEKSLEDLRTPFSPDIAPRVVGVTPVIPIESAANLPASAIAKSCCTSMSTRPTIGSRSTMTTRCFRRPART
jgi:hypothetical protein